MFRRLRKNKILLWQGIFAVTVSVLFTTSAVTQDQSSEIIAGSANDPTVTHIEMHSRRRVEPKPIMIMPVPPGTSQVESTSVGVVPGSTPRVFNCIPLANNVDFGFSGFIYRNVPAFTLLPGDHFAFDLGGLNDVDVQRNIYFAVANINPAPAGCITNVVSQGITALGWTKVVSDTQTPLNPRGNTIVGDYELIYTAETMFQFPGGGFIIGFGGSPPGTNADGNCEQVMVTTTCNDASGSFYARFFNKPDQTLGVLDVLTGGNNNGNALAGVVLFPSMATNQPPVALCQDVAVFADSTCMAMASVDHSSFDPDGGIAMLTQTPPGPYPLGTTEVTLTVTDFQGASDSCTATVTVVERIPPTIITNNTSITLSPANNQYTTVSVSDFVISASDNCDPTVDLNDVYISRVSCDEQIFVVGSGNHSASNDVIIAPDCKSVQLKATRDGGGNGRVYTITFKARDAMNNVATVTGQVTVPTNPGPNGAAQDDGTLSFMDSACP